MKKLFCALFALALLCSAAACGAGAPAASPTPSPTASAAPMPAPTAAPTPEPTETPAPVPTETPERYPGMPALTRATMPRLDGSTSTAPLATAVCAAVLGETAEDVEDLVLFHKTTASYLNLLHGDADLLIVGEANQEVLDEKEALGFEWLRAPFATDAFVFVVNENNPVESITVDQARRIYTGEITNWSELGGEDRPITALQRNQGAGSQTLMEKLVMRGEPMMEAPEEYIVATMGQLMSAVKSYDGSADAIGYSVYYYAEEMKMAQGLKLLRLEGVEPSPETIRSEAYPLVNPKYVVIPADAAPDSPARQLYDWLLSPGGQRLIADEGYVSVLDLDVTPKTTPLVGTRRYADYTDHLICADDYGPLIPFAGRRLAEAWPASTGCLYGLMTRGGEVVVDPVYSEAYAAQWYGGTIARPPLLLRQGSGEGRYALAAADGSWCTGFDYLAAVVSACGLTLFREDGVTLTDPEGRAEAELSLQDLGLTGERWTQILGDVSWGEGPAGRRLDRLLALSGVGDSRLLCLDLDTMETVLTDYESWVGREAAIPRAEQADAQPTVERAEILRDALGGAEAPYLQRLSDWSVTPHATTYYRADGTPLPQLTHYGDNWYDAVTLAGGLIGEIGLNTASYYDLDTLVCVFRTTLGYESD